MDLGHLIIQILKQWGSNVVTQVVQVVVEPLPNHQQSRFFDTTIKIYLDYSSYPITEFRKGFESAVKEAQAILEQGLH